MARRHTYSQHFLRSPKLAAELIGHSNVRKNDTVLDLGAGSGVISSVLARRARKVIAVENEPRALASLRSNLSAAPNVTVIDGDILSIQPPKQPYKIFSNIPFSLSAYVIRRFTNLEHPPKSIYVIVQKQFAIKLTSSNRRFTSALGAQIAPWWQPRIRKPLRRTDFTPPPAVDTVLLELKPCSKPLLPLDQRTAYQQFVAQCFHSQPFFSAQPRATAGINAERKPSELTPVQWCELWRISH